jgi:SAM-dependent methyltransferase
MSTTEDSRTASWLTSRARGTARSGIFQDRSPRAVDITTPSAARVDDAYLGGAHTFAVDRAFADRAQRLFPRIRDVVRAQRHFLRRAVEFLIGQGIDQFLDIGCGLLTPSSLHGVAQRRNPGARVLYADNDPIAVAQGRSMLRGNPHTEIIHGDLLQSDTILADPRARGLLDFTRPVGIFMVGLLPFVPDDRDPVRAVRCYTDVVPAGSYLAVSHVTLDGVPEPVRSQAVALMKSYEDTQNPDFVARDATEFARFFDGYELVPPGTTYTPEWRPEVPLTPDACPEHGACYAAVGRKSGSLFQGSRGE